MIMNIKFSRHAEIKIKERKIKKIEVEKILASPDHIFYDLYTKNMINIAGVEIENVLTNLVVVYVAEKDSIKVITVYPCKNINKEIKKKEEKRWVRIK